MDDISCRNEEKDSTLVLNYLNKRYVLGGEPVPKCRHRTHGGQVWDPQKQKLVHAKTELEMQHEGELYKGPLDIFMVFYFAIPIRKQKQIPLIRNTWYAHKPDIDNLAKFVLDAASKVLFHDDYLVARIICEKRYHEVPRTELIIKELDESYYAQASKDRKE